jgi:hypothetical protein
LLLLSFAVFSIQSSFIFPYLNAGFSSSSNSTCFYSSFLAGLRVDELQSGFESLWSRDISLLTASTPSLDPPSVLSISYLQTVPGRKSSRGVKLNDRLSRSADGLNLHFAIASVASLSDRCQLSTVTNLSFIFVVSFPSLLLFFASASTSWSLCFPDLPYSCMTSTVQLTHSPAACQNASWRTLGRRQSVELGWGESAYYR